MAEIRQTIPTHRPIAYKEINDLIRKGIKGPNYDLIIGKYKANKFKTEMIRVPAFEPTNPLLPNYIHELDNAGAI